MLQLTREQSQTIDRLAIQEIGISGLVLMENAGVQVAHILMKENPLRLPALILCGKGNNGGDGAVIARYLWNHHYPVQTVLLAHPEELQGEAKVQWSILRKLSIPTLAIRPEDWPHYQHEWRRYPLIVDALFGTGLQNELRNPFPQLIRWLNQQPLFKVAIDLPSGLCANTGQMLPVAVEAQLTLTFVAAKVGFFHHQGPKCVGKFQVIDIGIPRTLLPQNSPME